MKKLSLILAVVMVLAMIAALPASAAQMSSTEILKGTPVIDGMFDEIYSQSASYWFEESDIGAVYSTYDYTADHDACAYFLYDDNYFYMYIEVKDSDVASHGEDYIKANENPWMNDAVESWFAFDDEYICKVHNDAFGYTMYCSAEGNGLTPLAMFDTANSQYVARPTSSGYSIEVAFKPTSDISIKAGSTMGFCIQLNDIISAESAEAGEIYCSGSQNPTENTFTFSANEVSYPVETAEEEVAVEDVAVEDDTPMLIAANDAAATADAGVVAAAVVMAAAAAVVLSKKH